MGADEVIRRRERVAEAERKEREAKRRNELRILISSAQNPLARSLIAALYPTKSPYWNVKFQCSRGSVRGWTLLDFTRAEQQLYGIYFQPDLRQFFELTKSSGYGKAISVNDLCRRLSNVELLNVYSRMCTMARIQQRSHPAWWQKLLYG